MKKFLQILTILIFAGSIAVVCLSGIFTKDKVASENENRSLAMFPAVTVEGVLMGESQDDIEEYMSDQMTLRDELMAVRTCFLKLLGRREINGAYLGKDNFLFEVIKQKDVNNERIAANTEGVKALYDFLGQFMDNERLSVMVIPTSSYIYRNKLPKHADMFDQQAVLDDISAAFTEYNYVDVAQAMKDISSQRLYYRTDHHWTTDGAYIGYATYCDSVGIYARDLMDFMSVPVTEDFRGSLYSKTLGYMPADTILEYVDSEYKDSEEAPAYTVEVEGESQPRYTLYDEKMLWEKDKYKYFLGGNYGLVKITRSTPPEDEEYENLLIIKDSFANCFAPFVANDFSHVYLIDPRYYREDIGQFIIDNQITDVLVLYNVSNFISDMNLSAIGETGAAAPDEWYTWRDDYEPDYEEGYDWDQHEQWADETEETGDATETQEGEEGEPAPVDNYVEEEMENYDDAVITMQEGLAVTGDTAFETFNYNSEVASRYCDIISRCATNLEGKANVYDILIPTAISVVGGENVLSQTNCSNQQDAINDMFSKMDSRVKTVPIFNELSAHKDEYIYFRTDHHWTQLGAYYAYQEFCYSAGYQVAPLQEYVIGARLDFLGSFYEKLKLETMKEHPDTITQYLPKAASTLKYTKEDGAVVDWDVIHDVSGYNIAARYSGYIGGDNPFTEIERTEGEPTNRKCVVIKESFGNAFVPWLVDQYDKIFVLDYRYFNGSIASVVDTEGITDVIFINNMSMTRNSYMVGRIESIL